MTSKVASCNLRVFGLICLGFAMLIASSVGIPRAYAVTVEYVHTDSLGTPTAVTDESRTVIERSEYEPYGKLLNRPLSDGPGFSSHVQDMATGMTYMQQRYYDPAIGRFLSVDPVAARPIGDNFSRYWYANNNPYRFTDPDGRETGAGYANGQYTIGIEWTTEKANDGLRIIGAVALSGATLPGILRSIAAPLIKSEVQKSADARPDGVPKSWENSPSRKSGGERYRNPENPKSNDEVRTMPGNPNSSNPAQQKPYITRQADGKSFDAKGNQVPRDSAESHIKPEEFKFIPREQLIPKK